MRTLKAIGWIGFGLLGIALLLENSTVVTLRLFQDIDVEMPLSIALLIAMGLGALSVLLSTVWSEVRQFRINRQELEDQATKIRELEATIANFPKS
jgi:uncharacterized integral membrane protein